MLEGGGCVSTVSGEVEIVIKCYGRYSKCDKCGERGFRKSIYAADEELTAGDILDFTRGKTVVTPTYWASIPVEGGDDRDYCPNCAEDLWSVIDAFERPAAKKTETPAPALPKPSIDWEKYASDE